MEAGDSAAARFGDGLTFDGTNEYVEIADDASLDVTDAVTLEVWVKPTGAASAYWQYKKQITIDSNYVENASLTNFPVMVSVTDTDLKDTTNSGPVQPDGDDLLFTLSDGTKLSHEIESYDGSTGALVAWVKVPSLSGSADTTLNLYYGNPTAASQQDATNVWDSNYAMVQHLAETAKTTGTYNDHLDSTSNNNDGEAQSGVTMDATGKIDGGDDFDGTLNGYVDIASFDPASEGTVSFWINNDQFATGTRSRILGGDDAYEIKAKSSGAGYTITNDLWVSGSGVLLGTQVLSFDTLYHIAVTYKSSGFKEIYVNGALDASATKAHNDPGTDDLSIGKRTGYNGEYFDGILDEVRISSVARSSAWIQTSYNNQNSPATFMSFSDQTAAGFGKVGAYGLGATRTSVYGTINDQTLSAAITADAWNHVALSYDKNAGGTKELKLFVNGKLEATGDYATAIGTNDNPLLLGDNYGFTGQMDEVRVLNYARTAFGGGVVLDMVTYTPATDNEKIRLYNNAGSTVDIQGWVFKNDAGTTIKEYTSSQTIAAGGILTIDLGITPVLGTTDSVRVYDLDPDNDGSNENSADYTSLVDFVAWGTSGSAPTQSDDSTDEAVKAGFWTEDVYLDSNGAGGDVALSTQGNNDEAASDWDATAIPEFPTLAVPAAGVVLIVGLSRRRRRKGAARG